MPKRQLPPNETVISLYDNGLSSGEIAELFGVKPITVSSLLHRIGHPLRSPKEAAAIRKEHGRTKVTAYWTGKKQPREMVERRISKIRGEHHYLWKGGKSVRDYRKVVAKEVCATCGVESNLAIHHVNLDHYDNAPDNLIVLCVGCHASIHKQAYWDAIHAGIDPPSSNAPIGWDRGREVPE